MNKLIIKIVLIKPKHTTSIVIKNVLQHSETKKNTST